MSTWGLWCAWESPLIFLCTRSCSQTSQIKLLPYIFISGKSHVLQSYLHVCTDTSGQAAEYWSTKKSQILHSVMIMTTEIKTKDVWLLSTKEAFTLQIAIYKPLTFNFPTDRKASESFQSVTGWGFILNGIIDPERHLLLTLLRQQKTPQYPFPVERHLWTANAFHSVIVFNDI